MLARKRADLERYIVRHRPAGILTELPGIVQERVRREPLCGRAFGAVVRGRGKCRNPFHVCPLIVLVGDAGQGGTSATQPRRSSHSNTSTRIAAAESPVATLSRLRNAARSSGDRRRSVTGVPSSRVIVLPVLTSGGDDERGAWLAFGRRFERLAGGTGGGSTWTADSADRLVFEAGGCWPVDSGGAPSSGPAADPAGIDFGDACPSTVSGKHSWPQFGQADFKYRRKLVASNRWSQLGQ